MTDKVAEKQKDLLSMYKTFESATTTKKGVLDNINVLMKYARHE